MSRASSHGAAVVSLTDYRKAKLQEEAEPIVEALTKLVALAQQGRVQGLALIYESRGKPRCCARGSYAENPQDGVAAASRLLATMMRAAVEHDED